MLTLVSCIVNETESAFSIFLIRSHLHTEFYLLHVLQSPYDNTFFFFFALL